MKNSYENHYEWLRFVLNPSLPMPDIPDWRGVYEFTKQQAIAGICEPSRFNNVHPDVEILLYWIGLAGQLRGLNRHQNKQIVKLVSKLKDARFRCCILKGQGNATMYPDGELRTPGDIDVWVDTDEQSLLQYVKSIFPEKEETFKHITFPVFNDTGVDMHYTPLKFYHHKYNRRLQEWINANKEQQMTHYVMLANTETEIAIPTAEFNVVYQLGHIMTHLFSWGIGFRQLVDYYYVLRNLEEISQAQKQKIVDEWKNLGLFRMASAMMWIEKEILGIPEKSLLTTPCEKYGKMVLADVMDGGNFGKFNGGYNYRLRSFSRRLYALRRLLKFYQLFPVEVLSRIVKRSMALVSK